MRFDITHEGRTTLSVDRDSALALGYPLEAVDEAERNVRIRLVKLECRRRIYAAASAETQMNMATAAAVISSKAASARSDDEKATLLGLNLAITWVTEMRAAVGTFSTAPELDLSADENWPDIPPEVLETVDKF